MYQVLMSPVYIRSRVFLHVGSIVKIDAERNGNAEDTEEQRGIAQSSIHFSEKIHSYDSFTQIQA